MAEPVTPTADRTLVLEVVGALKARQVEVMDSVTAVVSDGVDPLDTTEPDGLDALLRAAVGGNVACILERMEADLPPENHEVPEAVRTYAVALTRLEVPPPWLRRAYHLATDALLSEFFVEVERLACTGDEKLPLFRHVASWVHRYVDSSTRVVLALQETEQTAGAERHLNQVVECVQRVLDREPVDPGDFAQLTGHDLEESHVAAVVWVDGSGRGPDRLELLRGTAETVGAVLGAEGAPLVVPVNRSKAWVWWAVRAAEPWRHGERVRAVLGTMGDDEAADRAGAVRVALGSPGAGVAGFRRSLEQARTLRLLTQLAPGSQQRVLSNDDDGMAVIALLAQDLPSTRRWVQETLGPLAEASDAAERMRETIRVYLGTGSYTETSEQLSLHRNTVKYRVAKFARERGRPLSDGGLDLGLALQVCHVLGPAVLSGLD